MQDTHARKLGFSWESTSLVSYYTTPRSQALSYAHTYIWSFEPNKNRSSVYTGAAEIYQYFKDFATKKYDFEKYAQSSQGI
jgi:hypothetical protein